MKSLLRSLLTIVALAGGAQAASTDTIRDIDAQIAAVDRALAAQVVQLSATRLADKTPVEQKVVEIHMSAKPTGAPEFGLKPRKIGKMPLVRRGTCSGEFVSNDGDVLTAKHCVEDFDTFEVQTYDRRLYNAVVVATSTAHDLALIHIDRRNTAYFELAEQVVRGQTVFVLGSPLAITDTLSTGIIARLDGDVTMIDCSALPGNSGGPVFDSDEKLVGVLNAGFIVMFGVTHLNMIQGLDAVYFFLKEVRENRDGR